MLSLILGAAGFGMCFLYDVNSVGKQYRILRAGFTVGIVLIAAATALSCLAAWKVGAFSGVGDVLLLALSLLAFGALIYCLFFALPFEQTYSSPVNGRKTYTCGAYALCRHPGVLCFFAVYLFLGLAALPAGLLANGMVFSVLNLAYAWFQDRVTFPKTFCDYEAYRGQVPFLIPTKNSIKRARQTWGCAYGGEEEL